MFTDAVVQYIKDSLAGGKTEAEIRQTLTTAGWSQADVDGAVLAASSKPTPSAMPAESGTPAQATVQPQQQNPYANFPGVGGAQQQTTIVGRQATVQESPIQVVSQGPISSQPQKSSKPVAAILAVIVLVLLGGGATFAYMKGIISLPFAPNTENPEKIFEEGLANISNVRSASYEGEFMLALEPKSDGTTPIVDSDDFQELSPMPAEMLQNIPQGHVTFTASGAADRSTSTANAHSRVSIAVTFQGMSGSADVEFLTKGQNTYIKLNSLDIPDELGGFVPQAVSTFMGKWIKITPEDIKQLSDMGLNMSTMIPSQIPDDEEQMKMAQEVADESQRILRIIREEKLFVFKETPKKETIAGSAAYRYNIKINGSAIPNIYKRAITESTSIGIFPWTSFIQFDQKVYDGLLDEKFQKIIERINSNMSWNEWVDIATKFITKSAFSISILPVQEFPVQYRVSASGTISDINKPVVVEEPTDSISIMNVFLAIGQADMMGTNAAAINENFDTELLKEARDARRVSDLSTLKSALSLYLADVSSPRLCTQKTIYASEKIALPTGTGWKLGANSNKTAVDGTGWIPVDLTEISSGWPIGSLPKDPVNDGKAGLVYVYGCDPATQTFKLSARLESKKYNAVGRSDVTTTDGGIDKDLFEVGTNLKIFGAQQLPKFK